MLHVAVVEDDSEFSSLMQDYLRRYRHDHHVAISFDPYPDGNAFLETYKGQYQMVFMDIVMPGPNGIATATRLRALDPDVCLIFITTESQYALHGYEVSAFDFIVKPLHYDLFDIKMSKAIRSIHFDQTIMISQPGDACKRLSIREITYLESRKHYLYFHTTSGVYRTRGRIGDFEDRLLTQGFVFIRKSILVNMSHITQIKGDTVNIGDINLPLARSHKQRFRQRMAIYIAGKA